MPENLRKLCLIFCKMFTCIKRVSCLKEKEKKKFPTMFNKVLMESITIYMGLLNGFTFKKGLKEMFSQIRRSARRVP